MLQPQLWRYEVTGAFSTDIVIGWGLEPCVSVSTMGQATAAKLWKKYMCPFGSSDHPVARFNP